MLPIVPICLIGDAPKLLKVSKISNLDDPLRVLVEEAEGLQIFLTDSQIRGFSLYLRELNFWNKKINLTGRKNDYEIVIKDFIDSLMISKYLPHGSTIIDIGSGAGFPGIPIRISRQDLIVGLLESRGKRISFLKHVVRLLKMDNLMVIPSGNSNFNNHFDFSVSRAFGSIKKFAEVAEPYLANNGVVLAMKGKRAEEELKRDLPWLEKQEWKIAFKDTIRLPVMGHERVILGLKKFVSRETFS